MTAPLAQGSLAYTQEKALPVQGRVDFAEQKTEGLFKNTLYVRAVKALSFFPAKRNANPLHPCGFCANMYRKDRPEAGKQMPGAGGKRKIWHCAHAKTFLYRKRGIFR